MMINDLGLTVLVVEDDDDTRHFLETFLHVYGYVACGCQCVEEAREKIDVLRPDLAILDINLPVEHGVSLAWELRNRWEGLPIIIASAVLGQWDLDDLYDCGADFIIQKPFDLPVLRKIVQDFIDHGRQGTSVTA